MSEKRSKQENLTYLVSKIGSNKTSKPKRKRPTQLTKPIESEVPSNYDEEEITASKFFSRGPTSRGKSMKINKNVDAEYHVKVLTAAQFGEGYQAAYSATSNVIKPLIDFWAKFVPRRAGYQEDQNYVSTSKLKLLIPYTVVFGVDEYPILYYTGKDGYVTRVDNITTPQIIKKLTFNADPEDYSVVQKNPLTGEAVTNQATLLNTKQLKTTLENQSRGKVVFQRFVKSKGPKATITRVCWSREGQSYAYMLSNKKSYHDKSIKEAKFRLLTNTEEELSVNVFKLKGPAIKELTKMTGSIVQFIEAKVKPKSVFSEFVADFIRDSNNNYWFVQCKGFKTKKLLDVKKGEKINSRARANYMRLKKCRQCLNLYHPNELMYKMTMKMIYATESHLKQRAVKLPWFDRPEFKTVSDTSMWYEPHPVCKNCFDMYIQEQKLSKVEVEFAKAIGIPVSEKANENASILTTLSKKLNTSRKATPGAATSSTKAKSKVPKKLSMYRFITYINEIRNVPDIIPDRFTLRLKVFKNELVIPVKIQTVNQRNVLPIGKLRVYYFFTEDSDTFREWLESYQNVTVNLYAGDERLGYANLSLNQFGSGLIDKLDYMVLFSSSKLELCSLRATMGFVKMDDMDLSNVDLEPWGGVYVPPDDFFTAHPLPDEWMEVIPTLSSQLPIHELAEMDPSLTSKSRPKTTATGSRRAARGTSGSRPSTAAAPASTMYDLHNQKSKPISKSKILRLRASGKSKSRRGKRLPYGHKPPKKSKAETFADEDGNPRKMRALSKVFSPVYSSRLGTPSRKYRSFLHETYGRPPNMKDPSAKPKTSHGARTLKAAAPKQGGSPYASRNASRHPSRKPSPRGSPSGSIKGDNDQPEFSADEYVWKIHIKVGSVFDLKEIKPDDTWLLKFELFGSHVQYQFESFQLMEGGALIFTVDEQFEVSSTESNLMNYFGKERLFKLIFCPKFDQKEEHVAAIDLRQFQKSDVIDLVATVEQVSSDSIDNTRFMEVGSDDDELLDEDDEEQQEEVDTSDTAKVPITIKIHKGPLLLESPYKSVKTTLSDYDVKILE